MREDSARTAAIAVTMHGCPIISRKSAQRTTREHGPHGRHWWFICSASVARHTTLARTPAGERERIHRWVCMGPWSHCPGVSGPL